MGNIEDLDEKLKAAEAAKRNAPNVAKASASAGIEFVVAILACTAIGYFIDDKLGTKPLFILIMMMVGAVVAFYNMYKASEKIQSMTQPPLPANEKDAKTTSNTQSQD